MGGLIRASCPLVTPNRLVELIEGLASSQTAQRA